MNDTVHTYVYDSVWKDKLISYDGKAITYDPFGCPITYMVAALTWDANGNLISITGATPNGTASNISYSYLSGGQRSEKTVDGVTTQYHYNNGMLLSETTGDETLRYFYDSAGRVASLTYKKGTNAEVGYFFARNYQSDIIAIYRSSDSKLIGTYEYDLWGRPVSITEATAGIDTDGILTKNPFRYRGYYYDSETGFYNLNLRYYDPTICRFISADSMDVLTVETTAVNCKNLFSYCENNPVIARDSTGAFWDTLFDVASLVISVVDVFRNPVNMQSLLGLAGDVVDLCPFVSGVGEAIKGSRFLKKFGKAKDATKAADNALDASKATTKLDNVVEGGSSFRNQDLLDSHYDKHAKEFGNISKEEYLKGADNLVNSTSKDILTKTRTNGDIIFYNPNTNEFAVKSADGYIRTYFKPKDGIDYFNEQ